MKKNSVCLTAFLSLLFLVTAVSAQLAAEVRPFDFSDKYYNANGVIPEMLIGRKNGADGESVFDSASERKYNNVRITATLPAYNETGATIFWNDYAGVSKAGFTEDAAGPRAVDLAYDSPLYVFPSTTVKNSDRQAALIQPGDSYLEKNTLGISAVFFVEFTDLIYTKEGQVAIEILAKRNGLSLDGTPIIRTAKELEALRADKLVTVTQPALDEPYYTPFAIAKIIQFPELGGITPDAFLKFVKGQDEKPLDAETHLVATFECLKQSGTCL